MEHQTTLTKIYLTIIAVLGWFALIAQFYININSKQAPESEIIVRYFSYFTILTNLLVAVCCTTLAFTPSSRLGNFFKRQTTLTAVTVYILIVGIIYNMILRFLWKPAGLQKLVDELLHSAIPLLFLATWIIFVTKDRLKWQNLLPWLIYPLVYILFILIRGAASGFYPYPFLNVSEWGLQKVLINALGVAIAFIVVSFLLIGIGNLINKKKQIS